MIRIQRCRGEARRGSLADGIPARNGGEVHRLAAAAGGSIAAAGADVARPDERRRLQYGAPGCSQIVALFDSDQYRILYLDTLNLEDAADNSFLLHELVHVLQYQRSGPAMYASCPALVRTEAQAYRAQNAYLRREGRLMQVGQILERVACDEAGAVVAGAYRGW